MLELDFYLNKNSKSTTNGKVYARVHNKKMVGIKELAEHIKEHGSPFTVDVIQGVLSRSAMCIRELAMQGTPVKIDDLCIFRATVSVAPADDVESFNLSIDKTGENGNIKAVRLQCRPTGDSVPANITRAATGELGWTTLAQKIKRGEAQLSTLKGEYLSSGGGDGWGNEPLNP